MLVRTKTALYAVNITHQGLYKVKKITTLSEQTSGTTQGTGFIGDRIELKECLILYKFGKVVLETTSIVEI